MKFPATKGSTTQLNTGPGRARVMRPDNTIKAIAALAATISMTAGIRYLTAWARVRSRRAKGPACGTFGLWAARPRRDLLKEEAT